MACRIVRGLQREAGWVLLCTKFGAYLWEMPAQYLLAEASIRYQYVRHIRYDWTGLDENIDISTHFLIDEVDERRSNVGKMMRPYWLFCGTQDETTASNEKEKREGQYFDILALK